MDDFRYKRYRIGDTKMKNNIRITIFHKLFFVFLAVFLMLYGFSMYMNARVAKGIEDEVMKSSFNDVNYFLKTFIGDITRLQERQQQFLNDYELQKLSIAASVMNQYERSKSIQYLQGRALDFEASNSYINSVNIYVPLLERIISTKPVISDLNLQEYKRILEVFRNSSGTLVNYNNRLFLNTAFLPGSYGRKSYHSYVITVELSKQRIINTMKDVFNEEGAKAILIAAKGELFLSTDESIQLSQKEGLLSYYANEKVALGYKRKEKIKDREFWLIPVYSNELDVLLAVFMPIDTVTGPYKKARYWEGYLSILSGCILIFYYLCTSKMFADPVNKLVHAFKEVEKGNLNFLIHHKSGDEFSYIYKQYNSMVNELKTSIEQVYEQKIRVQQAELRQLQYQINPHFLYNSLFLIYRMGKDEDCESVVRLSRHLVEYYRFITKSTLKDIPLKVELEHAKNYIEIQKIRFGDRIKVNIEHIPIGLEVLMVPPLIIQPLIENAYIHGLKDVEFDGNINIKMILENSKLIISVEDNGKGITGIKFNDIEGKLNTANIDDECSGILNVHRRLKIKFGKESGIKVARMEDGGTQVQLIINIAGGGEDAQSAVSG
jgi:two-component system, sensor histidine kinase YesM